MINWQWIGPETDCSLPIRDLYSIVILCSFLIWAKAAVCLQCQSSTTLVQWAYVEIQRSDIHRLQNAHTEPPFAGRDDGEGKLLVMIAVSNRMWNPALLYVCVSEWDSLLNPDLHLCRHFSPCNLCCTTSSVLVVWKWHTALQRFQIKSYPSDSIEYIFSIWMCCEKQ